MLKYMLLILDWSEVWAILIPLAVLFFRPAQAKSLRPVIIYLYLALIINIGIDVISELNAINSPEFILSNNPLYNLHSIVRFTCFSIYFIKLPSGYFPILKKAIPFVMVVFLVFNFGFFENIFEKMHLSGNLLAAEAFLLLLYCMQFYLSSLKETNTSVTASPHFWVVTGLSIYLVINFFVFLFYVLMLDIDPDLAEKIWNLHNIAFIIFCIFTAKAFYGSARH